MEDRITFREYCEELGIPFREDPERGDNIIVNPVDCLPYMEDMLREFPNSVGLFLPDELPVPRHISG